MCCLNISNILYAKQTCINIDKIKIWKTQNYISTYFKKKIENIFKMSTLIKCSYKIYTIKMSNLSIFNYYL